MQYGYRSPVRSSSHCKPRKKGYENPVLNGYRFTLDRSRDGTSFWKCCLHKTHTYRLRITTVDKQLTSPIPQHTHDVQHAETTVHVAKQNLKRRAATADLPTKFLCAEAVSGMSFEARSKLGCLGVPTSLKGGTTGSIPCCPAPIRRYGSS